ncbi:MAG: DEAD/DEAH box helicase [Anaerolineales bacterium]|nr:DEAD/DEAH box helicase [Anaerolineales bacterium]
MQNEPNTPSDEQQEPENALPPVTFQDLPAAMQRAAARAGWSELTPVQAKAIPYLRARRDLMVQARTGSGKTGAFVLPLLERIDPTLEQCQVLVLVPTRELAQQVARDAALLAGPDGFRTVAVYGGTSYGPQIEGFKQGAHLVVGTPGRVLDHLLKRNLDLKKLRVLIFDEADRMMSMGFYPDMLHIQEYLPRGQINAYMFSATIPSYVIRLSYQFLQEPEFLSLSRDHIHVEDTEHVFYLAPGMDKDRALVRIIEMELPNQAIIFCNTKTRVNYVTIVLQRFGYNAEQISSDLAQQARDKVIKRFREGKLRFLVATDVAARGIDIPEMSHVFQYEPPDDLEAYIHRAGRTGRAGASGTAILLININERRALTRIAAHYKIEFEERQLPQDEDVESVVAQRLIGQLEARLRERDKLQIERMQRFIPLVQELAANDAGQALLAMLLDDTYHDWMHHPPEIPGEEEPAASKKPDKKSRSGSRRSKKRRY